MPPNNTFIQTDAGWDRAPYARARAYFSERAVADGWERYLDGWDLADVLAHELGLDPALADDEDFLNDFWSLRSPTVEIATARACHGPHRWLAVVALPYPGSGVLFERFEQKAIQLGVALRSELGLNCPVVNDNKDAVRALRARYPDIQWRRRRHVRRADALSLDTATRVFLDSSYRVMW